MAALYSATSNRYATYGLALGAVILTGYLQMRGKMSWVGNWDLWSVVRWSDMGPLELDRPALVLNRLFVLALALLFVVVAVALFPRRQKDPVVTFHRLAPASLLELAGRMAPVLAIPLVLGTALWLKVEAGPGARPRRRRPRTTGSRTSRPGRTRRCRRSSPSSSTSSSTRPRPR